MPLSETDNELMSKMKKNIEIILSKLETKDLEMELLATEVKTAYATIDFLQKRIVELELKHKEGIILPEPPSSTKEVKTAYATIKTLQNRVEVLERYYSENGGEQSNEDVTTHPPQPPPSCLLLGDTNLRRVQPSYLHNNNSVRTINGVNISQIRNWVLYCVYYTVACMTF